MGHSASKIDKEPTRTTKLEEKREISANRNSNDEISSPTNQNSGLFLPN